jgi:putative transposase
VNGEECCTELGTLERTCWQAIPEHFPNVHLDAFVVMPNHVHGILLFRDVGVEYIRPLPVVVASFKAAVSRKTGTQVWQRNYYEHIIRNADELNLARHYIEENPQRWRDGAAL